VELDPELVVSAVKAKLAESQSQAAETMVLVHKVRIVLLWFGAAERPQINPVDTSEMIRP
jgi:hypothetical protein